MQEQPQGDASIKADLRTGEVYASADAPLNKPSRRVVSLVWLGIVYGAVVVMVASAAALIWGMFNPERASLVKPDMVLILFSTSAAFCMGLVARDPGQHG